MTVQNVGETVAASQNPEKPIKRNNLAFTAATTLKTASTLSRIVKQSMES